MKKILSIDSTNIIALMERANLCNIIFRNELKAADNPPQREYNRYPRLYAAYEENEMAGQKVEQTGFQAMPKEAYEAWLKSLEDERQKQQNEIERQKMNIRRLKNRPSTLNTNSKG